jgi:uncharacterized membrane protein YjgN (DUF898 family)
MFMLCPKCGTENPEKTWQCLCGHFFVTDGQSSESQPTLRGESASYSAASEAGDGASAGETGVESSIPAPAAPAPPAPPPINERFAFHGDGSAMFSIYLANLLFTVLTLGIYYFWGKAKVRRYVYGQSSFANDRFDYHGTGMELFLGGVKAGLLFGVANLLSQLASWNSTTITGALVGPIILYLAFMLIIPIAIVGTQRFRLSRTSWRAIRFSFRGHASDLLRQYIRDSILVVLTLGLYAPFFQNRLRTFLVRNSYFGSKPFSYRGEGWDLFWMALRMLLLIIPTLGLYWYWYTANKHRYYWEHTSFGEVRFRSTMQGGELAKLRITNLFLVLFTLGLAYPWAIARAARYSLECLSCYGAIDLGTVFQQATDATATGEGMVEMLDAGILDIDFGF